MVLHTRRKRAEHNNGTGRVAGSTAGGDPGVQEEATQDVGGGNNVGFIENGDYIYFNRMNFEDLTADRLPRGLGRRGRQDRAADGLADRRDVRLGGRRPDGRLAELDDGLGADRQPAARARTCSTSCSRTRPTPAAC